MQVVEEGKWIYWAWKLRVSYASVIFTIFLHLNFGHKSSLMSYANLDIFAFKKKR